MTSKVKKPASRVGSATPRDAASIAASSGALMDLKRPRIYIWPEWNDVDINAEKWEAAHKGGKDKEKGKSPTVVLTQILFDDPDGRIELPKTLKVDSWKRPQDLINVQPLVVDNEGVVTEFDLVTNNEHLHVSELMRNIICQMQALWQMSIIMPATPEPGDVVSPCEEIIYAWKPWEHIFSLCKAGKGPHLPLYNPYGKYVVRLYWMGAWRKITIDDTIPVDEDGNILLPVSTVGHELWPLLLTKALIKVASLDYAGGSNSSEYGDFSILHCLSGRLPEIIPLQNQRPITPAPSRMVSPILSKIAIPEYQYPEQMLQDYRQLVCQPYPKCCAKPKAGGLVDGLKFIPNVLPMLELNGQSHMGALWDLLKVVVGEWELPEQEWQKREREAAQLEKDLQNASLEAIKDEKPEKESSSKEGKEKPESKTKESKGKDKGKDGKDEKKKEKDKDKHKEKSPIEDMPIPDKPEINVFAYYWSAPKYPVKVSVLGDVADASERLRQHGLCHLYPHPIWITHTRSISMIPPDPPVHVPAWKLIRPRKRKPPITDEPQEPAPTPKPIQCLEITSPFLNYKVTAMEIPTDVQRPDSSLTRGQTHTQEVDGLAEVDERNLTPETPVLRTPSVHDEPIVTYSPPLSTIASHTDIIEPEPEPVVEEEPSIKAPEELKDIKEKDNKDIKGSPSSRSDSKKNSARKTSKGNKPGDSKHKADKDKEDDSKPPTGKLATSTMAAPVIPSNHAATRGSITNDTVQGGLSQPTELLGTVDDEAASNRSTVLEDDSHKPKKMWIDYDVFYKSFKNVFVYHKPQTYQYREKLTDLKNLALPPAPSPVKDKKTTSTTQGPSDERSTNYLFVDSLEPIEIVVSYSVISRWNDPHPIPTMPIPEEKKHSSSRLKEKDTDKDKEKEMTTMTASSVIDVASSAREHTSLLTIPTGTLVAEPCCWKSLVTGQPILRIRTTGTKAAVLSLPVGRHVLKFLMSAPLGYHVHLCSTTKFVFGDEDMIMAELTKESCRFVDTATQVINGLGKCMQTFNDEEQYAIAEEELINAHCPYLHDKTMSKQLHFTIFNEALYSMLKKHLSDSITHEIAFAIRVLMFDATTKQILGNLSHSRPGTSASLHFRSSSNSLPILGNGIAVQGTTATTHRGSAKPEAKNKKKDAAPVEVELEKIEQMWAQREITPETLIAAIKIQKVWRGYYVRKIKTARIAGTEDNLKVLEQLQKCWSILSQTEDKIREYGLFLMRHLLRSEPDIMTHYTFYNDEWNKISYTDYTGNYPEQAAYSWFIVFREVFYVTEDMLVVPKLYCSIPTCLLRVVNNDTGEDMHRIFQKVAPHVYKKNRTGYTFVAEARTTDSPLAAGKWRMRLIGSLSPLPAPVKPEVTSLFQHCMIQDYYVPNDKDIIARYSIKVTEDHLVSVQVSTSKSDVLVKLMILDREEELISTTGKGHVVLPAFIFLKNHVEGEIGDAKDQFNVKRSGSRNSQRTGRTPVGQRQHHVSKRSSSHNSRSPDSKVSSSGEIDYRPHKYIIQAVVMRNSWPLSESNWAFVQTLKEQERNDLKVLNKERPQSAVKDKVVNPQSLPAKGGAKPAKGGAKGGKLSRPVSQHISRDRPNFTLRIVSDNVSSDDIDIKKDTERPDEIRAMKRAWEDAQPGRAAKALQSRLAFISTHTVKPPETGEGDDVESVAQSTGPPVEPHRLGTPPSPMLSTLEQESVLTLYPPRPSTPSEILQPLDIQPFLKPCLGVPRYFDEVEQKKQEDEQKREIQEYKEAREQVELYRQQEKAARKQAKKQQIEDCEALQLKMDSLRDTINIPREEIRKRYAEIERQKQQELADLEAAEKAEQEAKSPKNKSAKGKKASAKGKKK